MAKRSEPISRSAWAAVKHWTLFHKDTSEKGNSGRIVVKMDEQAVQDEMDHTGVQHDGQGESESLAWVLVVKASEAADFLQGARDCGRSW